MTLKITCDGGTAGVGDVTLNGRELVVASYIADHVAPCLIGRDAHRIEAGAMPPDRLPDRKGDRRDFGVSRAVVREAYSRFAARANFFLLPGVAHGAFLARRSVFSSTWRGHCADVMRANPLYT